VEEAEKQTGDDFGSDDLQRTRVRRVCALASSLLTSSPSSSSSPATPATLAADPELSVVLSYPVQQVFDRCHTTLRRLFAHLAVQTEVDDGVARPSYNDESDVKDTAGITPDRFVRFAGECSLVPKLLTEMQLQVRVVVTSCTKQQYEKQYTHITSTHITSTHITSTGSVSMMRTIPLPLMRRVRACASLKIGLALN
jgi:hypothetical protein